VTVVVGGVGQLYQGDLDFARAVIERLPDEDGVLVTEFDYGAVAVAQELLDLRPAALILVGAAERGRAPGTLERRRVEPLLLSPSQVRQAVAEAVTGYVSIDLVLEVASGLGALPAHAVVIDFEPALTGPSPELSPAASAAIDRAVALVADEVRSATAAG
jgi:hydrogenase maturation protease